MRTTKVLVLGAIIGAAVMWLWGRQMQEYVEEKTRGMRTKAAEGVRTAEEKVGEFLQDTTEDVREALRAGQEAIRPAPATRRA